MPHIPLVLVLTLFAAIHSFSGTHLTNAQEALDSLLESYDKRLRPNGTDGELYGAVKVSIGIHIVGIESVDIKKGIFKPRFYFRQRWIDKRLQFEHRRGIKRLRTVASKVWVPDIFFDSEQDARLHNIPIPQSFVLIAHTGEVLYSQSLSMTLGCPMNLQNYPFDMHLCNIRMESYQYSNEDIHLAWESRLGAVGLEPSVSLYDMSFALDDEPASTYLAATAMGNYTSLIAGLMVKRSSTTAMSAYIPSTLLAIIAWLCLCLEVRATVPRLTVLLGLLILMILQAQMVLDALPTLNYLTVMHNWLITCALFIVMALIETILVSPAAMWNTGLTDEVGSCPKRSELLRRIDLGFQVLYAVSFILFIIIYWSLIHANTKVDEWYWNSLQS